MHAKHAIAFLIAVSILAGTAEARLRFLRGEALLQFVAGSTIYLRTPLGALPITYNADGTMSGRSKRLARYTGSVKDSGKWWVRRNKLCQRWSKWLRGRRQCFTLRNKGNIVYWRRNDGTKGTARIARN